MHLTFFVLVALRKPCNINQSRLYHLLFNVPLENCSLIWRHQQYSNRFYDGYEVIICYKIIWLMLRDLDGMLCVLPCQRLRFIHDCETHCFKQYYQRNFLYTIYNSYLLWIYDRFYNSDSQMKCYNLPEFIISKSELHTLH